MEYLDNCPVCGKNLQLQQINLTTAIFICMDLKCPYPVYGDCMVVKRGIENITKPVDLLEAYKKDEKLESSGNVPESVRNFAEGSLMLDLEELLSGQGDYYAFNETKKEEPETKKEEPETKKEEPETKKEEPEESNFQSDLQCENNASNSQSCSLELPELDDFLNDLLLNSSSVIPR